MDTWRSQEAQRRNTLVDDLYHDLLNSILNGDFEVNARLPTEATLAHDYGVSRTTVRSALSRLKDEKYIASRQGSGSVVIRAADTVSEPFAPVESLADLERCFECRISLEGEIVRFAALRRSEETVALLERHIATLEELIRSHKIHTSEDTEFHMVLAEASGNHLFERLMTSIRPYILFGMNLSKTLSESSYLRHAKQSLEEHKPIVDAVRRKDPEAAREAMRIHLERSRDRIFKGS